jgi:hypothetical protein
MPKRIYLELDKVVVTGHRKDRWNLYMIFMMDHPEDPDQKIITTVPDDGLLLQIQNKDRSRYTFKSKPVTPVSSGKRILDIEMPDDGYVELSCLVMHSRDNHRTAGEIINNITNAIQLPEIPGALKVLNLSVPWMVVANTAFDGVELLGTHLEGVKDRKIDLIHIQGNFSSVQDNIDIVADKAGSMGKGARLYFDWRLA